MKILIKIRKKSVFLGKSLRKLIKIRKKPEKILKFDEKTEDLGKVKTKLLTIEEKSRLEDVIDSKKPPLGIPVYDPSKSKTEKEKLLEWLSTIPGFIEGFTSTDIGSGLISTKLYDYQLKFLNDKSRLRHVTKARQTGFSYIFSAEGMAKCMLKSTHTGIFTSFNEDEAKEKVRYAKALYESMPARWRLSRQLVVDNKTSLEWEAKRGGLTTRLLSHPQKDIRGKGGSVDIYLDELAHYIYGDKIFLSAMPVIIRGGGVLTCGSTPLGKTGRFYDVGVNAEGKYAGFSKHMVYWWDCLTKGTTVMTFDGWKFIEDIEIGDLVLTHKGRYKKVIDKRKIKSDKNIFGIKSWYCREELKVTEDEKFLIMSKFYKKDKYLKRKWEYAKNLKIGDYLVYPLPKIKEKNIKYFYVSNFINCEYSLYNNKYIVSKKWNQKTNITKKEPKTKLLNKIKNIDAFLRICGYWIAEGCASNNSLSFSFGYTKQEKKYIDDLVKQFKLCFNIDANFIYKPYGSVWVHSKILSNLFKNLFSTGAHNKRLPNWIIKLPAEKLLRTFIETYTYGDGTFTDNMWGYGSVSKTLILQLRDIFLRNKMPASYGLKKGKNFIIRGKKYKSGIIYGLGIYNGNSKMCFFDKKYFYMPIKQIKKIKNYKDYVYDVNVKDDHSLVTTYHTVHNCSVFCIDIEKARKYALDMVTEERVYKFGSIDLIFEYENMNLEEFQQEFECLYIDERVSFFPYNLIMSCVPISKDDGKLQYTYAGDDYYRLIKYINDGNIGRRLIAGYDVGRKKDTAELIILDEDVGTRLQRVVYEKTFENMKFNLQKDELRKHLNSLPIVRLGIDKTGLGNDMAETLEDEFPGRVEGIPFSNEWKESAANQLLIRLQDKLILLPNERKLISHIHSIKRTITQHGHFRYDTEKNEKHHADKMWALALACMMGEELQPHSMSSEIIDLVKMTDADSLIKRRVTTEEKRLLAGKDIILPSAFDPYSDTEINRIGLLSASSYFPTISSFKF